MRASAVGSKSSRRSSAPRLTFPERGLSLRRGVAVRRFDDWTAEVSNPDTGFTAGSVRLRTLLENARDGRLQLPDFQRSWVWDEERIRGLIASVSRGFPVGAVMTLRTGGAVEFKPRTLEGTPASALDETPESLLLDGQQRLTSLYQVLMQKDVVATLTPPASARQKVVLPRH